MVAGPHLVFPAFIDVNNVILHYTYLVALGRDNITLDGFVRLRKRGSLILKLLYGVSKCPDSMLSYDFTTRA